MNCVPQLFWCVIKNEYKKEVDILNTTKTEYAILTQKDLLKLFPFGKTKLNQLLQAGVLPVVKVGRTYITNQKELDDWFRKYKGKEIQY